MVDILKSIDDNDMKSLETLLTEKNINEHIKDEKINEKKYTPLTYASEKGNLEIVTFLIEKKKADIEMRDAQPFCPLYTACLSDNLNLVKYLVEKNAKVNRTGLNGFTPAFAAAEKGNMEILKYLESKKANLTVTCKRGGLIRHAAIKGQSLECLKYLLDKKLDNNTVHQHTGRNILYEVYFNYLAYKDKNDKWLKVAEMLINSGVDVNFMSENDGQKETALHLATRYISIPLTRLMLNAGVSPNSKSSHGNTSLMSLFFLDKSKTGKQCRKLVPYDLLKLLFEHKAGPNIKNNAGITPFMYFMNQLTFSIQDDKRILKLFLENGADVASKDFADNTPLHYAAKVNFEMCKLLIKHEANPNAKNGSGETPLFNAVQSTEFDFYITFGTIETAVEYLLMNGAKVLPNDEGVYPHFLNYKSTNLMVKYGCDLNVTDNKNNTILHHIIKTSNSMVSAMLVNEVIDASDEKFDLNLKDKQGNTILALMNKKFINTKEVEKTLQEKGYEIPKEKGLYLPSTNRYGSVPFEQSYASNENSESDTIGFASVRFEPTKQTNAGSRQAQTTPKRLNQLSSQTPQFKKVALTKKEKEIERAMTKESNNNTHNRMPQKQIKEIPEQKHQKEDEFTRKKKTLKDESAAQKEIPKDEHTGQKENPKDTKPGNDDDDNEDDDDEYDIMISYNWDHKETAYKIRDYLREKGNLKIWIDVEQMSGNLFKKMAEAVIKSKVIILCCSTAYENSPNCRKEYEYVGKKLKPFVPVFVENKFQPTDADSLDLILGMQLYYKVDKEKDFNTNLPLILDNILVKIGRKEKK